MGEEPRQSIQRDGCLGLRSGWSLEHRSLEPLERPAIAWASRSWLHLAAHSIVQDPRHVQLRPVVPVVDDQDALSVDVSRELRLIPGDDPLVQVKRVFGQSVKGRRLRDKSLPFDRSGGRDLRLRLLEERKRDAGVRELHAA